MWQGGQQAAFSVCLAAPGKTYLMEAAANNIWMRY